MLVARAPQSLLDGFPVRNVARDRSDVHFERRVAMVRRAPRVRGLVAENPLPNVVQLRVVVIQLLHRSRRWHIVMASLPAVGGAAPPSRSEVWYYGAAVLLWRSDVQEWYYPALREGITHVTIDSHNVARTVVELKKDDKAARRMAIEARNVHENHLCPSCLLEHWTYVLTKYNSRFGLRFLDLPATLALLDAKARGEVAVGV